jgi:protein arginine N-methyltransferase 1
MTPSHDEPIDRHEEAELGQFIPLHYHFNMLNDVDRTGAFEEAIDLVVPDGGKVVELGGGTGVLSFFAARRAARVWCVELNPELADVARTLLHANGADTVEVIQTDGVSFVPPEPVDVVICEMLHVGLLREKQIQVLAAFTQNYLDRHGPPLPRFIPEATVQAVQPVDQNYDFNGYYAPTPLFQDGNVVQERTLELGPPTVYHSVLYEQPLSEQITWSGPLAITHSGELNALRFITKNLLAILPQENRSVDWRMNYLVVPLETPSEVDAGDTVHVTLDYRAGAPLTSLVPELRHAQRS